MCVATHGREKSIEAGSQRPSRQPTVQSQLARSPTQTPTTPPSSKAPLKRPPTKPTNKNRKKRDRRKSESSEGDEDIEEDPDEEEADDVLDIDSLPIENLDRENERVVDLPNPLLGLTSQQSSRITLLIIQVVSVLTLEFSISGFGSIRRFLGSLTHMGVVDAQAALGGVKLCICDFLTNTQPDTAVGGVPSWNTYVDDLTEATFTMAYEFMVTGGVVIALCMPEQYISIV
ncbi:hypothetical protein L7F22_026182 [Adiantum nelumboides]|nr:hypothetical protein [Adiantum nelumboides]